MHTNIGPIAHIHTKACAGASRTVIPLSNPLLAGRILSGRPLSGREEGGCREVAREH